MRFYKYSIHFFYLMLLFSHCVQEFEPSSQGYDNLLVVEAFLSNGNEPFEVKLSRSTTIDTSAFIPEYGAQVSLTDDIGEKHTLSETSSGIYQSMEQLNAQVGRSYQLHIQTASGKSYESSEVIMRKTPVIDDLRYEFQEKPNGEQGVQFYVNAHDDENKTWYYRWEWDETWEFMTPYDSYLLWEDDMLKLRDERINICWKFGNSTTIEISTSKNLSSDFISDYPLLFVSTMTDRLKFEYSLNVRQYALSAESYTFWNELKKTTENLGTLFDPQPSVIKGNMYNINDDNEVVLGYFDASEVHEQRIFINNRDLPPAQYPNYYSYCYDSIDSYNRIPAMIKANWMLVTETINEAGFPAYLFSIPSCIDCRIYGTNKKPDYWD